QNGLSEWVARISMMSEPNQTPESTPAPTPAPVNETPAAPAQGQPPPAGAKPPASPPRGKRPPRGDKPRQESRPKLDFTELTTNVRLNELDKDIESDLAEAMAGFESKLEEDTEAARQQAMKAAEGPKGSGRKKGRVISIHGQDVFIDVPGGRSQGYMPITQFD